MEQILNSPERRLFLYMGMIHSSCGMWTWCFSEQGELYYTSCPCENELQQFFYIGGCMDYALNQREAAKEPFIMNDTLGMIWAGEYVQLKNEKRLVVIGPVFYMSASAQFINEKLQELGLSVQMCISCMKIMNTVPVVHMTVFMHYVKMLHYAIYMADGHGVEIRYQHFEKKNQYSEELIPSDFEMSNSQEALLLQCVRDGNVNYAKAFENLKMIHSDLMRAENPQRYFSNVIIIFISQCARAAIEGGLSVKTAKELEWKYINRVEKQRTLLELRQLEKDMLDEFIHNVNEAKNSYGISKPIRECCTYVKGHFTEPLTLSDIAKQTGYTEYYLTRKFQKEMGIKLLDYIKEVRLEYAKIWLATTDKSIQEISSQLQFDERSYFSRVFKKKNGVTPAEFRNRMWNGNKEG